jgi:hypothetical protein
MTPFMKVPVVMMTFLEKTSENRLAKRRQDTLVVF